MARLMLRYEVWVRAKTEAGQGPPTRTVTARLEQRGGEDHDCDDDEEDVVIIMSMMMLLMAPTVMIITLGYILASAAILTFPTSISLPSKV